MLTALGNANINVGGREIRIGQQSINIRGVGLIDDGGNDDLTQGYKVEDIENVVLTQANGVPVLVKDVAKVSVGYVPRLGIVGPRPGRRRGGGHRGDEPHRPDRNEMMPEVQAEIAKMNSDGSLPPGVKLVPYYDRSSLVAVTTHTVMHNLIFGCRADLPDSVDFPRRSAQRDHRRPEYSLCAVVRHHAAGAAWAKARTCCPWARWISASSWIRR